MSKLLLSKQDRQNYTKVINQISNVYSAVTFLTRDIDGKLGRGGWEDIQEDKLREITIEAMSAEAAVRKLELVLSRILLDEDKEEK